jgi:hypothetical protein
MESHRNLLQLKVGGLLAILDGRMDITESDWAMAGIVCDTSTAVREATQDVLRVEAMRREDEADRKAAKRAKVVKVAEHEVEDTERERALEAAAKSVARRARKVGPLDARAARHAIAGKYRAVVTLDEATAHAVDQGWLVERDGLWITGAVEP